MSVPTGHPALVVASDRTRALSGLGDCEFDLLIIGGGITGAGLALEASSRGLSVALVESDDFAAGTSSRSSKLIHGGLRYLESLEFGLVRKTALERKELHAAAPHLAQPRWMVLPAATRRELFVSAAAVRVYESLGRVARVDRHEIWRGERLRSAEPLLDTDRQPWAVAYREYVTDDARLVLAQLRAAAHQGAHIVNRARVVGFVAQAGRLQGVRVRNVYSHSHSLDDEVVVRARAVVNAAGPWVDELRRFEAAAADVELGEHASMLHLSKGVHIVVPAQSLPVRNLLMVHAADRRRMFIMRRGPVVHIGTTDTSFRAPPQLWPSVTEGEAEYLLEPLIRYFGREAHDRAEIVGSWAGLRPLVADPRKVDPGRISRKEELVRGPLGVVTIAGGKLTGFAGMARQVMRVFEREHGWPGPLKSGPPPLPGALASRDLAAVEQALAADYGVDLRVAQRLTASYGSEAAAVVALGAQRVFEDADVIEGELEWCIRYEGVLTLEDLIYRRLRWPVYEDRALSEAELGYIGHKIADRMGWDAARVASEVEGTKARWIRDLGSMPAPGSETAQASPAQPKRDSSELPSASKPSSAGS